MPFKRKQKVVTQEDHTLKEYQELENYHDVHNQHIVKDCGYGVEGLRTMDPIARPIKY